ncbi:MAG: hypothetical protein WDM91_03620 [Rhizomicrobium sp.]
MRVAVVPVTAAEKPLLWDRLQDYIEEMTAYVALERADGVYDYPVFDLYWKEPDRFAFWAVADGARAAFALVHRGERTEMAEFYSFPAFRRSGVAFDFARQILKRFPGPWTLSEFAANSGAVAFWHKVISDYPYAERTYVGGSGQGRLEQNFTVPG